MADEVLQLELDVRPLMSKLRQFVEEQSSSPITAGQWNELTRFVVIHKKKSRKNDSLTYCVDIELPSGMRHLH